MSARRDPDRLVHDFLMEGQTELADPVLDAVRATIEQKRQRVVIGPWRMPNMNKLVPIGFGAVVVVVALVVGRQFFGAPASGGVGAVPPATPAPSVAAPSPTPAPSVPAPSPTPEGLLPEGSHVLWDEDGVRMTVTIAAPAWYGERAGGILSKGGVEAPDGTGMIVFAGFDDLLVYGDPCRWASTTPKTPATTVDEVVAALAAQVSRDASAPVDMTLDGHAGKSITLHVPDDAVFAECDEGKFASWGDKEGTLRHQQDPGQINNVWVGDVDGGLVIIDRGYYEGTPQAVIDEQEAIVKSVVFE